MADPCPGVSRSASRVGNRRGARLPRRQSPSRAGRKLDAARLPAYRGDQDGPRPGLTLVEVQSILRHAHVATTTLYTAVGLEDLLGKPAEHYQRSAEPARWAAQYSPDDVAAVFGDR
jgi:hypothetical protein